MITGTVLKGKKIKKRNKQFTRLHSTRFHRVKANWRRPRGIDNKDRKHMNGGVALPSIGYRTDKKYRFRDENNLKRVTISDKKDLEMIAMHKHDYCGEFSKKLSARRRKALLEVASNYGIKITNNYSRIEKIES
eukprot:GAHX01000087.1.p1 GENE.GAHX01000087.1~~GAHX01000087.1.p1  ORF type:complete len:149 (-),score=31.49 GAHX01000087.1:32-433(-)